MHSNFRNNTHNKYSQGKMKVSSSNKRSKSIVSSDSEEDYFNRKNNNRTSKRRMDYEGNYAYKEISVSSESSKTESGLIKFNNQTEKQKEVSEKHIAPWMSNGTANISDSLLRFHNQIIQFYNYIKPSKKSHSLKMKKFNFIKQKILGLFPKAEVIAFGSFATQLYLPDGDVDIAVLTNGQYNTTQVYNKIDKLIESKEYSKLFTHVQYIRKSKVPLIKFQYEDTYFDISVDKADGINQISYVQKISSIFPEFKYLTLVFKCTLRIRSLAETYTGGIGSFLLSCMLLVYLRITVEKGFYYNLGEHVVEFMKFYAINNDYWKQKIILVKQGKIIDRNFDGVFFSCLSPQDQSHDIGKSAFKIKDVFNVLKNRYRYIMDKNFMPGESILRVLVNPSEQQFQYLKQNQN